MRTCLGLEPHECTTYDPIRCQWILEAPKSAKIAFLQGLNDGDGSVSVTSQYINNACEPNNQIVQKILKSLSISSTSNKLGVFIRTQKGIIKAFEVPFFRHATGRQKRLEKLASMMQTRQIQKPNVAPPQMIQEILELHKEGLSLGELAEYVYDKFGLSFSPSGISIRLKN